MKRTLLLSKLWRNWKISMTRKLCFLLHLTVKESELFAKSYPEIWQATSVKYLHAHSFSMIINVSQGKNFSTVILRFFYWFASFRHTLIRYLGLASFSCSMSRYGHVIILMSWHWCQVSIKHFFLFHMTNFHPFVLLVIHLFVLLKYYFSGAASLPCCRSRWLEWTPPGAHH